MENSSQSHSGSNAATAKPRRRLRPEVAARHMCASADQVSRLYEKPVEQLTPLEIQAMKQAFFRGL